MLRHALEGHGHTVVEARDEPGSRSASATDAPVVVLTDLKLPVGDGFGVLRAAKELDPELQVVVMTAYGSIQDAVTAMKDGAMDFLAKPIDPDHLLLMVERAIAQRRILTEYILLKRSWPSAAGAADHRRGCQAASGVAAAAPRGGDGRDGPARRRAGRQGALCPHAARAEPEERRSIRGDQLRGDSRHAAGDRVVRLREGCVHGRSGPEARPIRAGASRDVVSTKSATCRWRCRPRFPRALEAERQFERVGGTQSLHVDVRVVAATNRQLKQRVAERQFREDLYFRLSVFPIQIPPLRERSDDILILARHFVEKFCRDLNKKALTPARRRSTSCRPIRGRATCELQNCIERAVILTEGDAIHARHLSLSFRQAAPPTPVVSPWESIDLSGTLRRCAASSDRGSRATEDQAGPAGRQRQQGSRR